MINRILMELYDDYEKNNIKPLIDFANITFSNAQEKNLFIGCTLIMFNRSFGFKARYECTRENLLDIVKSSKVKVNNTNMLNYYMKKINTKKGIYKYLQDLLEDNNLDDISNNLISYLEQFKPKFIEMLKERCGKNDS